MHNANTMTYEMTIKITTNLPMQMQNKNSLPYLYPDALTPTIRYPMTISSPLGLQPAHVTDNTTLGTTVFMSAWIFPVMLFLPTFKYAEPDDVLGPTQR